MIDYYMGFEPMDWAPAEWGKWNGKIRNLTVGQAFIVDAEQDRTSILRVAKRIGVCVRSRKLNGGYEVQRIKAGAPRQRGHPKRNQYD